MSHQNNSGGRRRTDSCRDSLASRRIGRVLTTGIVVSVALITGVVDAQVDDSSHRRLNGGGRGFGDLQAQAVLLSRLQMLTNAAQLPNGGAFPTFDPEANPGVTDPQVQQALQQMLSQQLLESLMSSAPDPNGLPQPGPGEPQPGSPGSPGAVDVSDPRIQEALRNLPPETRRPVEDMLRQQMESNPGGLTLPPSRPGTNPNLPGTQPGGGRPRSLTPGRPGQPAPGPGTTPRNFPPQRPGAGNQPPEDPETRQERIARLTEMLQRLSNNNRGQPRPGTEPGGSSNPGGNGRPGTNPNSRAVPEEQPSEPRTVRERAQRDGQLPDAGERDVDGETREDGDVWQKLGRIMQQARDRGNGDGSSSGAEDGARSALARAIEETATDWAGQAGEFFEEQNRPHYQEPSAGPGFFERVGQATDSANDWAVDLASGEDSGRSRGSSFGSSGDSDGSSFSLMSLVVVSLILTTCIAVFRNRDVFHRESTEAGLPQIPRHLRNRRDVVHAFHALAARFPEILHDWWPHRRAAVALARVNPGQQEAIETLAGLYEEARYLPEESEFSEQQLESARRALRRFEVS